MALYYHCPPNDEPALEVADDEFGISNDSLEQLLDNILSEDYSGYKIVFQDESNLLVDVDTSEDADGSSITRVVVWVEEQV